MAQIPMSLFDYSASPYHVLRVDNIPTSISLRELTKVIEPYCRSIIGVARSADYNTKRLGHSVYYITTNRGDAEFLQEMFIQFVDDGRDAQRLTIVDSVLARACLSDLSYVGRYEKIPVATYLKGLPRLKPTEGFTKLLINLLIHFDTSMTATYIRLGYDNKKHKSRNDCYITYLNQNSARLLAGEVEPIKHLTYGVEIEASLSTNVPIIIRMQETFRLEDNKAPWSAEIEDHNQLMIKHKAPFVHPRRDEVDEYTGDIAIEMLPTVPDNPTLAASLSAPHSSRGIPVKFKCTFKPVEGVRISAEDKLKDKVTAVPSTSKSASTHKLEERKTGIEQKKPARIVYDLTAQRRAVAHDESSTESEDSGEHLIINEDVILDDEAEAGKNV